MYLFKRNDDAVPVGAKRRSPVAAAAAIIASLAVLAALIWFFGIPYAGYLKADRLMTDGAYYAASEEFSSLDGFLDSGARRDECYYLLGVEALTQSDAKAAASYYFRMTDAGTSALFKTQLYDYAASALASGENEEAMELFSGVLSDHDNAAAFWAKACYAEAESCYAAEYYSKACEYYLLLPEDYEDAAEKAQSCMEIGYAGAVSSFEATGVLPEGYSYLSGYKDYDSYAALSSLNAAPWDTPQDVQNNLSAIYALGDFKDVRKSGFLVDRLFGHRWEGGGYYFEYTENGTATEPRYNFPAYNLDGYYGLYFKFNGDSLYIGSDVADSWTRQLIFEFDELDETLYVTSVMAGTTYKLNKVF